LVLNSGAKVTEGLAIRKSQRELLAARIKPKTNRVMVSGFGQYPMRSATSVPVADGSFTLEQWNSAKAFLATEMNDRPLTHRVIGILWGGSRPIRTLEIRFNLEEDLRPRGQIFADHKRSLEFLVA
jgi:hypothetical protein